MAERCSLFRWRGAVGAAALAVALGANARPSAKPTVEELKARLPSAIIDHRPRLCVEIAQQQLAAADKFYAEAEDDKAQTTLTDVVAYSELARDYVIQSHKHQKQTEIAVRGMIRKLTDLMHSIDHAEQAPVHDAINRLERVRDDLLTAMFPKGAK
jgi:NAD-specific glutamate dehydrogenase